MDLLKGYGSDSDSSSAASSPDVEERGVRDEHKPSGTNSRGRKVLSLGAVLPSAIFDRLTRPAEDDSSMSSHEDGPDRKGKKRKYDSGVVDSNPSSKAKAIPENSRASGADRTEMNSLLSELRSTPLHVGKKDGKTKEEAAKSDSQLGMAFMQTTTRKSNKKAAGVIDIHAASRATKPTMASRAVPQPPKVLPKFSRAATAPVMQMAQQRVSAEMPQYPVMEAEDDQRQTTATDQPEQMYTQQSSAPKSRRQLREEERMLRSGISAASATEIHQPSPSEFAPNAHAAVIASKTARMRSGAGRGAGAGSLGMYDPSSGSDKGGIAGKHRSKNQINSLVANAISLEAHRATEAELAKFGMGSGVAKSSRADAKKKYGW